MWDLIKLIQKNYVLVQIFSDLIFWRPGFHIDYLVCDNKPQVHSWKLSRLKKNNNFSFLKRANFQQLVILANVTRTGEYTAFIILP